MTRRSTFRGGPSQTRSKSLYWWGVAGNAICCLTFSALLIGVGLYALDHLG